VTRRSNTEERREQIARALLRVMAKKGYDGASIADIAREASLTQGLVHYHFESKLDVLLDVLDRLAAAHRAGLEAAIAERGGDPKGELEAFVEYHLALERANEDALAAWVTISAEALREKRVRKAFGRAIAEIMAVLEGILVRAKAKAPKESAAAILAAIQGYYVLAAGVPEIVPKGSAADQVMAMAAALI
jgi:TetR/AcrR family transcriptional regulator, transcriptional repressor of bet genes